MKVFICGNKEFNKLIADELYSTLDIKSTKHDIHSITNPNVDLLYRQVARSSAVIINLGDVNEDTMYIIGIAKALGILIVGVANEYFFTEKVLTHSEHLAYESCELNSLFDDVAGEIYDYIF